MDRTNTDQGKMVIGFIDFMVMPLFNSMFQLSRDGMEEYRQNLIHNRKFWAGELQEGHIPSASAQSDFPALSSPGKPNSGRFLSKTSSGTQLPLHLQQRTQSSSPLAPVSAPHKLQHLVQHSVIGSSQGHLFPGAKPGSQLQTPKKTQHQLPPTLASPSTHTDSTKDLGVVHFDPPRMTPHQHQQHQQHNQPHQPTPNTQYRSPDRRQQGVYNPGNEVDESLREDSPMQDFQGIPSRSSSPANSWLSNPRTTPSPNPAFPRPTRLIKLKRM
eukprot:TRINITY_DN3863_c0_g1_i2.p1 TRINITY_DN3863_c0_g1~~TRINITY_DN3863_c0_g1_i2.p1  ORF type:complete len:271 (+),score=63.74 TRINITY_DN3863_c0_g1_i2:144-956(+)